MAKTPSKPPLEDSDRPQWQRQAEIMINQIGEGITSFEEQQRADAASFSTPVASRSCSSNTNTSTSQTSSVPISVGKIDAAAARHHHHPIPGDVADELAVRQVWGPPIHSSPGPGWMDSGGATATASNNDRASLDELSWAQSMIKGEIHAETSGVLLVTDVTHERLKELLATEKAAQELGWENSMLRRALESAKQSLAEKDSDMLAVMTEWRLKMAAFCDTEHALEVANSQITQLSGRVSALTSSQQEAKRALLEMEVEREGMRGLLRACVESLGEAQREIEVLSLAVEEARRVSEIPCVKCTELEDEIERLRAIEDGEKMHADRVLAEYERIVAEAEGAEAEVGLSEEDDDEDDDDDKEEEEEEYEDDDDDAIETGHLVQDHVIVSGPLMQDHSIETGLPLQGRSIKPGPITDEYMVTAASTSAHSTNEYMITAASSAHSAQQDDDRGGPSGHSAIENGPCTPRGKPPAHNGRSSMRQRSGANTPQPELRSREPASIHLPGSSTPQPVRSLNFGLLHEHHSEHSISREWHQLASITRAGPVSGPEHHVAVPKRQLLPNPSTDPPTQPPQDASSHDLMMHSVSSSPHQPRQLTVDDGMGTRTENCAGSTGASPTNTAQGPSSTPASSHLHASSPASGHPTHRGHGSGHRKLGLHRASVVEVRSLLHLGESGGSSPVSASNLRRASVASCKSIMTGISAGQSPISFHGSEDFSSDGAPPSQRLRRASVISVKMASTRGLDVESPSGSTTAFSPMASGRSLGRELPKATAAADVPALASASPMGSRQREGVSLHSRNGSIVSMWESETQVGGSVASVGEAKATSKRVLSRRGSFVSVGGDDTEGSVVERLKRRGIEHWMQAKRSGSITAEASLMVKCAGLEESLKVAEEEVVELRRVLEDLEGEHDRGRAKIEGLEERVGVSEEDARRWKAEAVELAKMLKECKAALQQQEVKDEQVEQSQRGEKDALQNERDSARTAAERAQQAAERAQQEIDRVQGDAKRAQEAAERAQQEIDRVQGDAKRAQEAAERAQGESEKLRSELAACKDELRECKDELRMCKDELRECKDELGMCKDELRECKDELRMCKDELRECKDELGMCKDELRECKDELGMCKDELRECKDELDQARSALSAAHASKKELEAQVMALEKSWDELNGRVEQATWERRGAEEEEGRARARSSEEAKQLLRESARQLQGSRERVQELEAEVATVRDEAQNLENERDDLVEEKRRMMSRIEELSFGLHESERQREAGARSAMLGLEDRAEAEARGRRAAETELKDARVEVSALKSEVMNLRVEYQRVTSEREREGGRGDKRMKSKVEGLEERCRVLRDEADHEREAVVHMRSRLARTCQELSIARQSLDEQAAAEKRLITRLEEARTTNLSLTQAAEADRIKWREMAEKSDREVEERAELEDEVEGLRERVERLTMHLEDAVRALEREAGTTEAVSLQFLNVGYKGTGMMYRERDEGHALLSEGVDPFDNDGLDQLRERLVGRVARERLSKSPHRL